jgi:hypothetical protein
LLLCPVCGVHFHIHLINPSKPFCFGQFLQGPLSPFKMNRCYRAGT